MTRPKDQSDGAAEELEPFDFDLGLDFGDLLNGPRNGDDKIVKKGEQQ